MDYEKYKNALEKAKVRYNEIKGTDCSEEKFLLDLFPELKESEDEKIRKTLIEMFSNVGKKEWRDIPTEKIVAWLEKQKEIDKEIVFRPLAGTDIRIAAKQALEKIEIGKEVVLAFNGAYIPVNGKTVAEICNGYFSWSEKQNKNNSENYCEDCINRKGCINCENGNLKETISLDSCEKQDEQDFSHNVEDEIRNELYDFIYITTFQPKDLKKKERFLAWLEKQGEQKVPSVEFKAKDWYVSNVDGKIHDMTYHRVQPKQEWSEDDERIVTALMEGFRYHQLFNPKFGEVPNAEIISWLKSLKTRLS